jgi:DNA-binding NtrC family response regulator
VRPSVLIVEDDAPVRAMVATLLREAELEPRSVSTVDEALGLLGQRDIDVILSDVRMPGRSGIELVHEVQRVCPQTPVVVMTGFASVDSAVESMRAGAFDYITKPFQRDQLLLALERALTQRLAGSRPALRRSGSGEGGEEGPARLVGSSRAMREIRAMVLRVASRRSSILITGESGTGKEEVARAIHASGSRARGLFVPVNCSAIPAGLLESELFGHVRGAFTGAVETKRGLFEVCSGGTLFLDEIGDMELELQAKLLRALENREIRPIGATRSARVDVRIIAASNKDLRDEMEAGRFRRDLFYRLNVIPIHIPPLRERPEDIRDLALHLVETQGEGRARRLSTTSVDLLTRMTWEGNVRELANVIERTLALCDDEDIEPEDIAACLGTRERATPPSPAAFLREAFERKLTLREIEDLAIAAALDASNGNKIRAARMLGISRRTLYRRGPRGESEESSE